MDLEYWHIVILFGSWAAVATTLSVVLIWYARQDTHTDDIEQEAIRQHFAAEEEKREENRFKLIKSE